MCFSADFGNVQRISVILCISVFLVTDKILWIRGEIAPEEQFLPFSTLFLHIFLTKGVKLQVHL